MLFAANTAVQHEAITAVITIARLVRYCIYMLRVTDAHQHNTFNRSRAETLL